MSSLCGSTQVILALSSGWGFFLDRCFFLSKERKMSHECSFQGPLSHWEGRTSF